MENKKDKSAEEILLSKKVKYWDWLRMKGTTPSVYNAILEAMEEYKNQFQPPKQIN